MVTKSSSFPGLPHRPPLRPQPEQYDEHHDTRKGPRRRTARRLTRVRPAPPLSLLSCSQADALVRRQSAASVVLLSARASCATRRARRPSGARRSVQRPQRPSARTAAAGGPWACLGHGAGGALVLVQRARQNSLSVGLAAPGPICTMPDGPLARAGAIACGAGPTTLRISRRCRTSASPLR